MKRIAEPQHYVSRELKEVHRVSCRSNFASLCDLLFFFPWWSLRG
jgi:hypothetical protein